VGDFATFLLRFLRYDIADDHDRTIHTHKEIGFLMHGHQLHAKAGFMTLSVSLAFRSIFCLSRRTSVVILARAILVLIHTSS
jgi:hypothetical protein